MFFWYPSFFAIPNILFNASSFELINILKSSYDLVYPSPFAKEYNCCNASSFIYLGVKG